MSSLENSEMCDLMMKCESVLHGVAHIAMKIENKIGIFRVFLSLCLENSQSYPREYKINK